MPPLKRLALLAASVSLCRPSVAQDSFFTARSNAPGSGVGLLAGTSTPGAPADLTQTSGGASGMLLGSGCASGASGASGRRALQQTPSLFSAEATAVGVGSAQPFLPLSQYEETFTIAQSEGDSAIATVDGFSAPSGFSNAGTLAQGSSIAEAFNTEYIPPPGLLGAAATARNTQTGIYANSFSEAQAEAVGNADANAIADAIAVQTATANVYAIADSGERATAYGDSFASSIFVGSPATGDAVARSNVDAIAGTDGADARAGSRASSFGASRTSAKSRAISDEGRALSLSEAYSLGNPGGTGDAYIGAAADSLAEGAASYAKADSGATAKSSGLPARARTSAEAIGTNNAPAIVAGSSIATNSGRRSLLASGGASGGVSGGAFASSFEAADSGRRALQQTPADPFGPTPPRPVPTPCPYGRRSLLQAQWNALSPPPSDFFSAFATAEGVGVGIPSGPFAEQSQTQATLAKATNEGDSAEATVAGSNAPSSFSGGGTKAEGSSDAIAVNVGVPGPILNTKSAYASASNYQNGVYSDANAYSKAQAAIVAEADSEAIAKGQIATNADAQSLAEGGGLSVAQASADADSATNNGPFTPVSLDFNQAEAAADATAESETDRALAYSDAQTWSFSDTSTFASTRAVSEEGAAKAVSNSLSLGASIDTPPNAPQVGADEDGRIFGYAVSNAEGAAGYATAGAESRSVSSRDDREARARAGSQAIGLDGTPAEASASSAALNQG